ncbi:Down syndrome cell adhesion molecule-like protein Dscam2 [Pollicipes pollicipes]|uniref:Down syndrome cell adhesion molecule-like protein Dscam2 n=1 Tax=Pollicipes pollicipes TaxID=41117 RepID=UPI0018851E0E|nr:Down syndrome cell adhesion molecule-like protein Dscam2 [Pollicipes pollicipes]
MPPMVNIEPTTLGFAASGRLCNAEALPSVQDGRLLYEGPHFVTEPPGLVRFTNSTGARLDCRGGGTPPVDVRWTLDSGDPVAYVPGVRESLPNGSLLFAPFPARLFRRDVHGGRYRCVVSSSLGRVVSRTVRLRPVVLQSYRVTARDGRAPPGQSALLTCHVPDHVRATVQITSWSVNGALNVYPTLMGDDKYHMLPSGELIVRDVTHDDVMGRYLCRTVHMMTDEHVISERLATVIVEEPKPAGRPPRIVASSAALHVRETDDAVLFCVGHASPTAPVISWSRRRSLAADQPAVEPLGAGGDVTPAGALLVIRSARPRHTGWYSCRAESPAGHATADVFLEVQMILSVSVSPARVTVNRGGTFRLTCTAPRPASLLWLRDGARIDTGRHLSVAQEMTSDLQVSRLEGADMKQSAQGMYQCFASSKFDSVQAAVQVLLGDSHPVLLEKFINHTVPPFAAISLRCVANASPTPQISWLLDGYPLSPDHRRLIGQYVSANNDVISHVNISSAMPVDGGWITCRAANRFGAVQHAARLNIYGKPQVRPMPEVLAVAGESLLLTCSVGGHPIHEITWSQDGRRLPVGREQRVFANGSLLLERVQKSSSGGGYSCTARGAGDATSTGNVNVKVIVPPSIRPFLLGNFSAGERAQVLCFIKSGDSPLTLTWLRDGRPAGRP